MAKPARTPEQVDQAVERLAVHLRQADEVVFRLLDLLQEGRNGSVTVHINSGRILKGVVRDHFDAMSRR